MACQSAETAYQTAGYDDFPFPEGWTVGNSFNQTQMYPDINISDNRIAVCYDEWNASPCCLATNAAIWWS